ncbi:hypothetical protein [uncultured Draconibacterium sp.]|uniref:hypothetical protein n=1 Tax=uncultured Draconibacterium sp. TaxID=1573823 RepID=UPI0025F39D30|nr:hypothetical protein [uncultured Draconibacterium sp.]
MKRFLLLLVVALFSVCAYTQEPIYTTEQTQLLLTQIAEAKTIEDLPVIKTRLTALKTDLFSIENFTDEITDEQYTGWQITGEIRRGDVFEVHGLYNLPTPVKQGGKAGLNDLRRRAKYYSAVLVTPEGVNTDAKFMPRHFSNAFSYGTEEKIWNAYTHRYDVLVQRAEYQANKQ